MEKFQLTNVKLVHTPMEPNIAFSSQQSPAMPNQLARMKGVPFSEAIVMNAPYFLSFSFPLLQTHWTPSLLFPFSLCHPRTTLCLPFTLWLLYLDMTHYDSPNESYLFLDLRTSDDSFYESSLYLVHDSYGL